MRDHGPADQLGFALASGFPAGRTHQRRAAEAEHDCLAQQRDGPDPQFLGCQRASGDTLYEPADDVEDLVHISLIDDVESRPAGICSRTTKRASGAISSCIMTTVRVRP